MPLNEGTVRFTVLENGPKKVAGKWGPVWILSVRGPFGPDGFTTEAELRMNKEVIRQLIKYAPIVGKRFEVTVVGTGLAKRSRIVEVIGAP